MTLNQNGQAITLSHPLADALAAAPQQALPRRVRQGGLLTLAHTFPPAPMRCGSITGWRRKAWTRCATRAWW